MLCGQTEEPVATVSSGHQPREQEGRLCWTWAEERELPLAKQKEQARRSQGRHSHDCA